MTDPALDAPFYTGPVRWLQNPTEDELDGFVRVGWSNEIAGWIAQARGMGMQRPSLDSPAQRWLEWLGEVDRLAVVGVHLDGPQAAADLLGFVVEPAVRRDIELVIGADHPLEELDPAAFIEPQFGYPYSLERLRWRLLAPRPIRHAPARLSDTGFTPDPTQAAAVNAGDGVVQIIAPAGSGKTTVLVERVRELRRRGVPANAIACLTFNYAAKEELKERLQAAGVGTVEAFTFHGFGRRMLIQAGELPPEPDIGTPNLNEWRRLIVIGKQRAGERGIWLEAPEAARRLSDIKLGLLMSSEEYAASIAESADPADHTMAGVYAAYEQLQRQKRRVDFDDLVLAAVRLLRSNEQVRGQWQARYQCLLVDEYQDIEPAQELIVRLIAAPHDQLFCVGDEDQTLYAFRRASVERIICLDGLYPGLERISLGVNYRCPPKVVDASRTLINLNRVRFPKSIAPPPGRDDDGVIHLRSVTRQAEAAGDIAKLLATKQRGQITVLARTTNALRPIALACADHGIPIDGSRKLFEPTAAQRALRQHLRVLLDPTEATPELVYRVCQTPSRNISRGAERVIAERLRRGDPFDLAFLGIPAPKRDKGELLAPGELFTELAEYEDANDAVALLRGSGGLDKWFEQSDGMGGLDQFECEVLEQAQRDAAGRTPRHFLEDLEKQAATLQAIRDEKNGIELLTIHGAKGRQWPHVIVVACNEGTLPHARALQADVEELARGEGIEAERRLGYVAFTRAQQVLELHVDPKRPSPFLQESGIAQPGRSARVPPPVPQPPGIAPPKRGLVARLLGTD